MNALLPSHPENPLFALVALVIALLTAWALNQVRPPNMRADRVTSIEGLRGYLGFGVFLHHAAAWFYYLRTDNWQVSTNLFGHFGLTAVALFFMITAFLFSTKLLEAREKPIVWRALFVSRVMRLGPLYLFAFLALVTVVLCVSEFQLVDHPAQVLRDAATWLGFSVFGEPDLNGVRRTTLILSGVTWSLSFEWFFYFLLPVVALLIGLRPPWPWALVGLGFAVMFLMQGRDNFLAYNSFVIGALIAVPARSVRVQQRLKGRGWSVAAIACLMLAAVVSYSPHSRSGLVLVSLAFLIIASGNTLFGVLGTRVSRTLGEMGYGLYLLHGLVLYVGFNFVIGIETAQQLSPLQHWLVVCAAVPILIVGCHMAFRYIETPGMRATSGVNRWMDRVAQRRAAGQIRP